jgi:multiple sugar transport system substrate-binding protein
VTREDILDALRAFSGTKLKAADIGFSTLTPAQAQELKEKAGVEVEIVGLPTTQIFEKLFLELSTGAGSFDIVSYNPFDVAALGPDYLVDLSPFHARYGWPQDRLLPCFAWYGWYPDPQSGKPYGVPKDGDVFLLHYRRDALEKLGLDPDRPPRTYDELRDLVQKAHGLEVDGKKLFGFAGRTARALTYFWWANFFGAWGGDWFTPDWKPLINSPEGVASLEYAVSLLEFGPPNATSLGFADLNRLWNEGDVAFCLHYQAMATAANDPARSKVAGRIGAAALPAGPKGSRPAMLGGIAYGIPTTSKHQEAAYLWARYVAHPTVNKELALTGQGVDPVWTEVLQDPEFQRRWGDGRIAAREELAMCAGKLFQFPLIPEWAGLAETLDLKLSQAYIKERSPKQALDEVAADWVQKLGRAGYYRPGRAPYRSQA